MSYSMRSTLFTSVVLPFFCTILNLTQYNMILKDEDLYVLEINTVPGMTKTSFIPQQAKVCGYEMKDLITLLIDSVN